MNPFNLSETIISKKGKSIKGMQEIDLSCVFLSSLCNIIFFLALFNFSLLQIRGWKDSCSSFFSPKIAENIALWKTEN